MKARAEAVGTAPSAYGWPPSEEQLVRFAHLTVLAYRESYGDFSHDDEPDAVVGEAGATLDPFVATATGQVLAPTIVVQPDHAVSVEPDSTRHDHIAGTRGMFL
jgi:hypothetical protein